MLRYLVILSIVKFMVEGEERKIDGNKNGIFGIKLFRFRVNFRNEYDSHSV